MSYIVTSINVIYPFFFFFFFFFIHYYVDMSVLAITTVISAFSPLQFTYSQALCGHYLLGNNCESWNVRMKSPCVQCAIE